MTDIATTRTHADDDLTWAERLARFGWIAKAAVYTLLALLTYRVAFTPGNADASTQGALNVVARQPFGRVLLIALAAGLFAYTVGRLVEAFVVDDDGDSTGDVVGHVWSALMYAAVGVLAVLEVVNAGSGGTSAQSLSKSVMNAPGGRWIVGIAGLAVVGIGLAYAYYGLSRSFMDELDRSEMSPMMQSWAKGLGVAGLVGRSVVFLMVGAFLAVAAYQADPSEARGLDAALGQLSSTAWGPWVILGLAVALAAYAAFCLVMARFREIT